MQNKSDLKWGQIEINAASASVSGWQPCQLQFDLNKYILSRYANLDIETWHPDPTQPHVSTNSNNIYFPCVDSFNVIIICATLAKAARLVHPSNPYSIYLPQLK
eukprot:451599_1